MPHTYKRACLRFVWDVEKDKPRVPHNFCVILVVSSEGSMSGEGGNSQATGAFSSGRYSNKATDEIKRSPASGVGHGLLVVPVAVPYKRNLPCTKQH